MTFEAIGIEGAFAFVTSLFLVVRWSLSCKDTGDERSGRGGTREAFKNIDIENQVKLRA